MWLGIHDPTLRDFAALARVYGLDEHAVHQAVTVSHRPKIERYGDVTLFVVRTTD